MTPNLCLRLVKASDLSRISQLQDSCYSDELYEAPELLASRLASKPNSIWLIENSEKTVLAYLFSYPARKGEVAALGSEFKHCDEANVLYLHDLAINQEARGLGLSKMLLAQAEHYAKNAKLDTLALVAVQGSVPFWQKLGFYEVRDLSNLALSALESYIGQNAVYMQKQLKP